MTLKKIVIATDCFLPRWDGISRFLVEVIPKLVEDFQITIIAPNYVGEFKEINGVKIIRIPLSMLKSGDYQVAKKKAKIIRGAIEDADIVWVHTTATIGNAAINTAKKKNIPVIMQIHSIDYELISKSIKTNYLIQDSIHLLSKKYFINFYKKAKIIISPSPNVSEMLEWNEVEVKRTNIDIGVDVKKFCPPETKELAKQNIGLSESTKVIGYCGRIANEKNIDTLIDAFNKIKNEYPDSKLLIIGKGIKKIEQKLKENKNIIHIESTLNVVPYLQAMDIFVLPSLVETTSLSTLEAMSCGIAPIVTPVGYVKHYIVEKENGLFFPFKNSTVLALKISWLLKENYVRKKLGENARKLIEQKFNIEKTIKKIIEILNDL